MWTDNVLHLPNRLWSAYESILTKYSLLEKCQAHEEGRGHIGGSGRDEALGHFTYRFANSAARLCYIVEDPEKHCQRVATDFRLSLLEGNIHILDLVGGTGAASSAMLCTIADLRSQNVLPMLPLNVTITAADISEDALTIYNEVLAEISPALSATGINVLVNIERWNALDVASTSALCDRYLSSIAYGEILVMVSALSGIGRQSIESVSRSFMHVSERISNRPSTFAWIEPHNNSGWDFLNRIATRIFLPSHWFTDQTPESIRATFRWRHLLQTNNNIINGGVSLKMYKRYGD